MDNLKKKTVKNNFLAYNGIIYEKKRMKFWFKL
jgi:hypothetical protein